MPIYEYECLACRTRFERSQRFSDPPLSECPECGSSVRRVLFPAGIVFKGSGWYITDSRKPAPADGAAASPAAAEASSKSEAKAEAKPAKPEGATAAQS
jgi:putative FmdB family regulatory protein